MLGHIEASYKKSYRNNTKANKIKLSFLLSQVWLFCCLWPNFWIQSLPLFQSLKIALWSVRTPCGHFPRTTQSSWINIQGVYRFSITLDINLLIAWFMLMVIKYANRGNMFESVFIHAKKCKFDLNILFVATYFNAIMFMVAASVVTTILVLNYHHRMYWSLI